MSGPSTDWQITAHPQERIIEVVYPNAPTTDSLERYESEIRAAILEMNGTWDCLVDQRSMPVLDAEMSQRIADLITWSLDRGMRHAARIVRRGSMAALQAKTLLRASGEGEEQNLFLTREEAWASLRSRAG
ncbi:MAG: hypothetical protein M3Y59_12790 [Myxococcota bacterium]|nr:hypothetical protein [Myxococcota bacterium]